MNAVLRTIPALLCATLLCTCDPAPEAKLFVERGQTGVTSANLLAPTESLNIVEYLYYYNGGGVAATDISGDGLPDLYFTNNQAPNRYYINEGNWHFRDATDVGGVAGAMNWSTGVSVTDINADGLPDIYVCNVGGYGELTGRNELFVQQSGGTFTEQAAAYGLDFSGFNTQAYWFDFDRDGDDDLYLLRHSVHNDATYGEATERTQADSLAGDRLLRNNGGRFADVTGEMGIYSSKIGYGLSAAIGDFDRNGYPDVYVCNDFSENDYLYLNRDGNGFDERIRERTGHTSNFSMGSDVGDLDRDGWPDIVSLDMRPGDERILKSTASADAYNVYRIKRRSGYYDQLPRNNVQWNRGRGHFSEIGELSGLAATDWSWSVLLEDFDLDGHPEVFVANGIERRPNDLDYLKFISSSLARSASNLAVVDQMPTGHVANQLFVRTGSLTYREADWGLGYVGSSTGAATADLDGDGDLDLVVNNVNAPAMLYENTFLGQTTFLDPVALEGHPGAKLVPMIRADTLVGLRIIDSLLERGQAWYEFLYADGSRSAVERRVQRGFLSQSAPVFTLGVAGKLGLPVGLLRYAGDGSVAEEFELTLSDKQLKIKQGAAVRPAAEVTYEVTASDSVDYWPDRSASFDREPLQPFAGATVGDSTLILDLPDGTRITGGMWQPLRFGTRTDGVWHYESIPGTEGWWQSFTPIQVDGRTEIIAGNWGLNSSLGSPTSAEPLRLYLEDIDGNGRPDPLITYVWNGSEYTLADKDELARQLSGWRRNNLSYSDFSRRSFRENFPDLGPPHRTAATLAHARLQRMEDGSWRVTPLPAEAQVTTLNAAVSTPAGILLGGNRLEVLPRVGRQDAAALQLLLPDGRTVFIDLGGSRNREEVTAITAVGPDRWLISLRNQPGVVVTLP
ncbi:hypothetical protein GGR28_000187 [Lewinella aquimaris]|uniref:VCBS repeat protein n=1 Tax=Neolewinella aquimaris TaxID=1835722 RepID=A0A840E961_9BACT|nr:VCBS repeat-containing protein [Neolewinella aquimaris]MBB4077586.1 hypothetical protein [Neolewinella aquimaris]